MTLALLTSALLSFGAHLGTTPGTDAPKATKQTLTLRTTQRGQLLLDGRPCRDTTLVLTDAHVGTRAAAHSSTVALPDGRIFYKGDVDIVVQSKETGTLTFALVDGEAILAAGAEE